MHSFHSGIYVVSGSLNQAFALSCENETLDLSGHKVFVCDM